MARIPSLRRSQSDGSDGGNGAKRPKTATRPENSADRGGAPEHDTKIDEATERAAVAIRRAAASAAADRARARARTSTLASASLVLGVVAVLAVATGVLAGLGVAFAVVALLAALGGISVTGRHYAFLAGRTEALVGLLLAVAAIVIGVMAITGSLAVLDTETNQVEQLREWLPSWLG